MWNHRFNTCSALAALTITAVVCVTSVALVGKPTPVQAIPAYAAKEGVKCGYCHVNSAGGGKRNYRGKFYKKNELSFANFDDEAEAKAAGEPLGADADVKPKSLTPPTATTTPETVALPSPVASPVAKVFTVAEFRKKAAATEMAWKKSPKSLVAKQTYSAALTGLAHAIMNDSVILPAKKYPEALKLSRQAAKLDPANKEASADVKRIEGVYKQMGRSIPK